MVKSPDEKDCSENTGLDQCRMHSYEENMRKVLSNTCSDEDEGSLSVSPLNMEEKDNSVQV